MIRKRQDFEEEFIEEDFYDPDAKKRLRIYGIDEEYDSEGVIHRCLNFLIHLPIQSRPKTDEKLLKALQQICTFNFIVDPNIVFFHLVLNHIILPHTTDGENFITVNPNPPVRPGNQLMVAIPSNSTTNRVSNDFKEALHKSVSWCQTNRGLQGKLVASDHFIKSLTQVCTIKKKANPEIIVSHLLKRGMVRFEEGNVVYDLPMEINQGHYMAVMI